MQNPKRNDGVFQLSLTELAFTLIFLLLLLAGTKVMLIEREKNDVINKFDHIQNNLDQCISEKAKTNACSEIDEILTRQGKVSPDELITAMQKTEMKEIENLKLKHTIQDLDAQITAMQDMKDLIKKTTKDDGQLQEYIESATKFKSAYEKFSGNKIKAGEEVNRAKSLAEFDEDQNLLFKSNRDLANCNGKLTYCTEKFIKRGFGLPPCWTDKSGHEINYLFEVELHPGGVLVSKAWPTEREEDSQKLPNINLLISDKQHSLSAFKEHARAIFIESKQSTPNHPECRHYVVMKRSTDLSDINEFNRLRLGVEDYFYKLDKTQNK